MIKFFKSIFSGNGPEDKPAELQLKASSNGVSATYFSTMGKIQESISKLDFEGAARHVRENLRHIPNWVKESRKTYGSFDIRTIPALEQGGMILAMLGDDEGLSEMKGVVAGNPDLQPWMEEVEKHRKERQTFVDILRVVSERPGCKQTDMKELLGEKDGAQIANLLYHLEKAGKIERVKAGRTYNLFPPGSKEIPAPAPKRNVGSHGKDRTPPRLQEINISSLSYVPLPRSPLHWEEKQVARERAKVAEPEEAFEIRDADWKISLISKIPPSERPDPAFRQMHPTDAGLVMIDDLGKAEGLGRIEASALVYDRMGKPVVKKPLSHGVYRLGVHPCGRGLVAMSKDCILHAYDQDLNLLLETSLAMAPEIQAVRKRFEIGDDNLKNHIRCVSLSQDASRYFFTAVDEAWCVDIRGNGVWGVKLPVKEGWTQVSTPSSGFGTSADVEGALTLMNLSLPFTPEELKKRYRELAKQWHPDVNRDDSRAEEKMKSLNAAAEVLTGIDAGKLSNYIGSAYYREMSRSEFQAGGVKVTMTMGMQIGEIHASDWIYAAGFAANSNRVYLAGYSGRVVLVDENGKGIRVYDVGNVPRRIIDTGDFLYLLTDTRLYVLKNDALHALIDVFDAGDLILAQTGFGLLESKRFRWFREDGKYLGSVVAKEPIRRVYHSGEGMIVETRQKRAVVQGTPKWWE